MIGKELKRLSRRELVDIIYQLKKNEQQLQEENELLKKELEEKRIKMSSVGSIAEAAMSITNVFASAQETADLYLKEIECMKQDVEKECAQIIDNTEKKVKQILLEGEKQFESLKAYYPVEYEKWKQLYMGIQTLEQMKKEEAIKETYNG